MSPDFKTLAEVALVDPLYNMGAEWGFSLQICHQYAETFEYTQVSMQFRCEVLNSGVFNCPEITVDSFVMLF